MPLHLYLFVIAFPVCWANALSLRDTKRRSRVKFYINKASFVGFYAPRHLLEAVRRLLLVEHVINQEGLSGYSSTAHQMLCVCARQIPGELQQFGV